jgi:hypothetical protein
MNASLATSNYNGATVGNTVENLNGLRHIRNSSSTSMGPHSFECGYTSCGGIKTKSTRRVP